MTDRQTPETLVEQLIAALKWQAQENGCYCETDISADEAGIPIGERCPYCLMGKACQELEALASRAVPSTGEATDLMLGDLEYWRKFLLRARSRAGETPEASVHIDHLTAAALCIGNVLKFLKSAAPSEPSAPAAPVSPGDLQVGGDDAEGSSAGDEGGTVAQDANSSRGAALPEVRAEERDEARQARSVDGRADMSMVRGSVDKAGYVHCPDCGRRHPRSIGTGCTWSAPSDPPAPAASDMICEQHPEMVWPHGDCAGPGCPLSAKDYRQWYLRRELQQQLVALEGMVISGRVRIEELETASSGAANRGSVFRQAGPVTIGCMAPESRYAMDLALERYRKHADAMKANQGYVSDDPVYSFAYWLFRWSGIVTGVNVNAPENPWSAAPPERPTTRRRGAGVNR